jgi:signal transduction histidine kinase
MSLGAKTTLLALALQLPLLAGVLWTLDRWLGSLDARATRETVALIAREPAARLAEHGLAALQLPDATSKRRLREQIQDVVMLSQVLTSVAVVDIDGRVIASDPPTRGSRPRPANVFAERLEVKVQPSPGHWLQGGDYQLLVPLVGPETLMGYMELRVHDTEIAAFYGQARRRLLGAFLAGLVVVGLLGAFVQVQLSRRAAAIARTLEDPGFARGADPAAEARDEFAVSLAAARRVRSALNEAHSETTRLESDLEALAQVVKMGVVLIRRPGEPGFANARALELLGVSGLEQLRSLWPRTQQVLDAASASRSGAAAGPPLLLEVPTPGGARRLQVELYRLGHGQREDAIVLLNDPELMDALESDVRLASQVDELSRSYRTVAHELKAPLSAMMINLDLLGEGLAAGGAQNGVLAGLQRHVAVLREEMERLTRSLADLLTRRAPPSDNPERFDVRGPVEEIGTLLAAQARKQGVQLSTRVPAEPVLLVGYRDRLKQALLNVAVNALEAMPDGGRLELEMAAARGAARIAVADTGPGIPSELLGRIDERDFTTKDEGSGLGLYMARALVSLHGGQMSVRCPPGGGTRVEIGLPLLERS